MAGLKGGALVTGFIKASVMGGIASAGIDMGLQGAGLLLDKIGLAPRITQGLLSGARLVTGAAMTVMGNPAGVALSMS